MKRLLAWLVASALGLTFAVLANAAPAFAAPAPVTATPHGVWGPYLAGAKASENYASVYSVVRTADHVYLAGHFSQLRGPAGTTPIPVQNLAALYPDGTPDTSFSIGADGPVRKIVQGPDGNLYVGGGFTHLSDAVHGSLARSRLGRVVLPAAGSAATVDTGWAPGVTGVNSTVYAFAFGSSTTGPAPVYVGGTFTTAKANGTSATRGDAAAFAITDGTLLPWAPIADNANNPTDPHGPSVRDILVDTTTAPGTTRVYIAGEFDEVNANTTYHGLALVTPDTGALVTSFHAPLSTCNDGLGLAMGTYGTTPKPALWLADGGQCNGLFAFSPGSGTQFKKIQSDGDVQTVAVQGGYVYVGGHMVTFDNQSFVHTARVSMATATADPTWAPAMNPTWSPYYYGVWSVFPYTDPATGDYYLYEGGVFAYVNGTPQRKFTWFTNGVPVAPDAPTNVTATAGDASATVTWNPPASDGGSVITSYTVTASPGGATTKVTGSPPARTATVTGLSNGTTYTFTVTATNAAGTSGPSAPSNPVTPAPVPGAPTNVTATPGDRSATVNWAPPTSGGSGITSYTVTATDGTNNFSATASGTQTSATVTGLTNGTTYNVTVTATNNTGTGPASSPPVSVTPAAAPGAPTGVTATAGDGSAVVSWTAPSDGGSAITSYAVTDSNGDPATTVTGSNGSPPPTSAAVSGLTNGTSYTFTVTATNAVGTGPASPPSNSVTPGAASACSAPGAPRYDLPAPPADLSNAADPTVPGVASWAASTGTGCSYQLQLSTASGSWSTVYSGSAAQAGVDLTAGGPYTLQARSVDPNGVPSAWTVGTAFSVSGTQESDPSVTYSGAFTAASNTGYWGGTATATSTLNDSASMTVNARSVSIVGIKCPGCGAIQVYVDGAKAGQVTEFSSTTDYRRVIFTKTWGTAGSHTVKIENLATSGHPKMLLDGVLTVG